MNGSSSSEMSWMTVVVIIVLGLLTGVGVVWVVNNTTYNGAPIGELF